jgi:hypothetical protein
LDGTHRSGVSVEIRDEGMADRTAVDVGPTIPLYQTGEFATKGSRPREAGRGD